MKVGKNKNVDIGQPLLLKILFLFILCFLIAGYFCGRSLATEILSIVSTAISIVLSIVAILYTLISGSNSSSVNAKSEMLLSNIEKKLAEPEEEIKEQQQLKVKLDECIETLKSINFQGDEEKNTLQNMVHGLSKWIDK